MTRRPKFDPLATLRAIAADEEQPATARVAACRALIATRQDAERDSDGKATPGDRVTKTALRLLNGGKNG